MGPDGIEPSTSPLSGVRSSHLSYGPRCSQHWWSWSGSNRRPPECKSGALPAELQPLLSSAPPLQEALPSRCNRGQLDTGIRDIKPPTTFRFTPRTSSGDPVACSPMIPKNHRRFMEWNDCSLLVHAVHSSAFDFQKLHPRSLLERR